MILSWDELPKSPGHIFYDRLQKLLREAGFDGFVEELCRPYYAPVLGAKSLPPGRYFGMHLVGYFEGIDSERGIEWRCADSLSLRDFLGLELRQRVPDHSWLSRTRARLPLEVHEEVFAWVPERLAQRGLVKCERIWSHAARPKDRGYHSRAVLKDLADGPWQTRIAEPKPKGVQRWQRDLDRPPRGLQQSARLRSGVAEEAFR